jgi:hypothetical protein
MSIKMLMNCVSAGIACKQLSLSVNENKMIEPMHGLKHYETDCSE